MTITFLLFQDQRLKDVLGPFQKYFEGLVNEESLDASEGVEISYAANKVKDVAGDTANGMFSLEEYHTAKTAFEAGYTLAPDDARFTYRITKCEKYIA
ncbi:hypothetical protein Tco_1023881, partial [Tanacetum coccineum]